MDGFQIFIYIVVGIIYLISQANKQAKKNQPTQTPSGKPAATNTGEIRNFEDLLKQLSQSNQPETSTQTKNRQELERLRQLKNQPEKTALQSRDLEAERMKQITADKEKTFREIEERRNNTADQTYKSYQSADEIAKNFEATPEVVNYESDKTTYKGLTDDGQRFEVFEKKVYAEHPLMQVFRNPESLRNAFIISEILGKKYE